MLISCTPDKKQMIQIVLDQPGMVAFLKYSYTDHMIPSMLKSDTPSPNPAIRCSGFTLRLVIPSIASPIIFRRG